MFARNWLHQSGSIDRSDANGSERGERKCARATAEHKFSKLL